MKAKGNAPVRTMAKSVVASALRIIELTNTYSLCDDLKCLSPEQQALTCKHLQVVSNWLGTQGLTIDDLVVVLAVEEKRKTPTYLFCFEAG